MEFYMLVIAHRGANKEAIENSYRAFELAVEGGSHRIELDARMTADKVPVVMHDKNLLRATGQNRPLLATAYNDIKHLADGSRVPKLADVMRDFLPRIELNIEIKGQNLELVELVCAMVSKDPHHDKVIISTPWPKVACYLRDKYPNIKRACLTAYSSGVIWPFFSHQSPLIFMEMAGASIVHPRVQSVDENFMDQARARNWIVYPWVTMDAEEGDREGLWTSMATLEVHGLCTNYPREFKLWLDENRVSVPFLPRLPIKMEATHGLATR
jgi:glycerophosphoryl diester phosphodiesterase